MQASHRILLAILFASAAASTSFAEAVRWRADLEQARQEAAQTGRMVLLHFWSHNCGPCVKLEREVFTQPAVAQAIEAQYVPVKLNVEEFRATAESYGVDRWPTDVILAPTGQVVTKYVCPAGSDAYTGRLAQVAAANPVGRIPAATPPAQYTAAPGAVIPVAGTQAALPTNNYAAPPAMDDRYAATAPRYQAPQYNAPPQQTPQYQTPQYQAPQQQTPPPADNRYAAAPPANRYAAPPAAAQQAAPPGNAYAAPSANDRYAAAQVAPPTQPAPRYAPAGQAPATQPAPTAGQGSATVDNPYANVPIPGAPGSPRVADARYGPAAPPATTQQPATSPAAQPSTAPAATAAAVVLPPGSPPLGMEGFCCVSLVEGQRWTKGDVRFGAVHLGRTYLFAGQAEQQRFLANPDLYAPVLTGNDPVLAIDQGQAMPGFRRHGVYYRDNVYLFSSEETLKQFSQNPQRYVSGVQQAMAPRGQMPPR
jgi:YHS domain-containing protein/thioredoxin-like negative regulator of GroEL